MAPRPTSKEPDAEQHVEMATAKTFAYGGQVYGVDVLGGWRRWACIGVMLDASFDNGKPDEVVVASLTVKVDARQGDTLLVASGTRKKQRVVAFHRGRSPADVVEGFAIRRAKGAVDWRDDKPLPRATEAGDDREPLAGRPDL